MATLIIVGSEARPFSSGQQAVADQFLLTAGRAGRIEVGTSVDEVYMLFGRANVSLVAEFREGSFTPVLKIHFR